MVSLTKPGRRTNPRRARWKNVRIAGLVLAVLAVPMCAGVPHTDISAGGDLEEFVKASGDELLVNDEPVRLRAVNFTNYYDLGIEASDLLTSDHHSERDYGRVKDMGFNSVRFLVKGEWYLQDEEAFWTWLDRNVAQAKQHGVRLIIDLHVPIGGNWLDPGSDDTDFDIWSDPEVRQQNIDIWYEIAERYQDEPAVAAYDLLNEPVTTDGNGQQWQNLAQEFVDAIRSVDDNHLVIVSGVYGVDGRFDPEGQQEHFLLADENIMYDFHFYAPYEYTHQFAPWVEPPRDGGRYPDPEQLVTTTDNGVLGEERIATPSLPAGTTDWRPYDSGMVTLEEQSAVAALPQLVVKGGMTGTVHFDDVTVTEYGPDGTELREVVSDSLSSTSTADWYPWGDSEGADPPARLNRDSSGLGDDASLTIGGDVTSDAGWNNSKHLFKVVPGHQYRIQGQMRGEDVTLPNGTRSQIRLELEVFTDTPSAPGDGFLPRDKDYLAYEMEKSLEFGAEHGVPMSVMEFGTVRHTLETEGKGGDRWVSDTLELLEKNDLSFGYWEYHDPVMGIYTNEEGLPDQPNTVLQGALREALVEDDR